MQRDVEEMIERFFGDGGTAAAGGGAFAPPLDVIDRGNEILVRADLPGLDRNDIEIQVEDGMLSVRGEREEQHEENKDNYRWCERWEGAFMRSIPLPAEVEREKIQAEFKNGVLEIRIPKKKEAAPKKIEIKGG
jgi:HSP20 family protein